MPNLLMYTPIYNKMCFLFFWLCNSLAIIYNLIENIKLCIVLKIETTDWFQIGKRARQGCILSPCLFNFYAEYIMRNVWLDEAQAGIKIAGRNINNLRYADDTTLMAESEELKSLLMTVKEESEKVGLKLNSQKTKFMASGSMTSWHIDGETVFQWERKQWERLYFLGLQNHCRWWLKSWN